MMWLLTRPWREEERRPANERDHVTAVKDVASVEVAAQTTASDVAADKAVEGGGGARAVAADKALG